MSQIEKLLVPLIDDSISFDDVNTNDFVGVYTEDINSPGLSYIYLVFVYDINNLRPKLATNAIDYVRRIGNGLYHIYKFPRITTDIQKVLSGHSPFDEIQSGSYKGRTRLFRNLMRITPLGNAYEDLNSSALKSRANWYIQQDPLTWGSVGGAFDQLWGTGD